MPHVVPALAKARSWCVVSRHTKNGDASVLFGDLLALQGIAPANLSAKQLDVRVIGSPPSPCPWREPCDSSAYLFDCGASGAQWLESSSTREESGALLVSTRTFSIGGTEALAALGRLCLGGSLLGPLAHEVNNVVQAMSSAVFIFRDSMEATGTVDPEDIDDLGEMVSHLTRIGKSLQTFARVRPDVPEPLHLGPTVAQVRKLLASVGRLGLVSCDVEIPEQLPPLHWRRWDLDFILQALLGNAVDAALVSGADPWVRLRAWQSGESVVLELSNTGQALALPADAQPQVSAKSPGRHLGYGLAATWAVLAQRGGSLKEMETKNAAGSPATLLQITLPLVATCEHVAEPIEIQ